MGKRKKKKKVKSRINWESLIATAILDFIVAILIELIKRLLSLLD